MGEAKPLYRASILQAVRQAIDEIETPEREAILARVPAANLETIAAASRTDWLDARMMFDFNRAIEAAGGRPVFEAFWERFAGTSTRIPLLRPVADGAARMFGSARGIVKIMPRTFDLVAKDLGSMRLRFLGSEEARLFIDGMPLPDSLEQFAVANAASVRGAFALVGADGTALVEEFDALAGTATIRARWGAALERDGGA